MPKIAIEPMSFTLASHVAIFIAMFISPAMAVAVVLGATVGFFFSGLPLVVMLRAASHIFFALAGSYYIAKHSEVLNSPRDTHIFSFALALIHAIGEMIVVSFFYFGGSYQEHNFFRVVILLVGLGSIVHSMIDYEIAWVVFQGLSRQKSLASYIRK
jgi:niacin transporter